MSITQTIDIPETRRITLDVPEEVPLGPVTLTFSPVSAERRPVPNPLPGGNYRTIEEALEAAAKKAADPNRKPIARFFGTLPDHGYGDGVAYQRAIRDEWD